MPQFVFLWTDRLIFLLLGAIIAFTIYALRHEHLRAPWRQVRQRPLAMSALVVLLAYVAVGLLDSVHLRSRLASDNPQAVQYAPEIISVLDLIGEPLIRRTEVSFSAPFATHAFVKEVVEKPDGRMTMEYPRLRYGGRHLHNPNRRVADIVAKSFKGVIVGGLIWMLLVVVVAALLRRRDEMFGQTLAKLVRGDGAILWWPVTLTAGAVIVLISVVVNLSTYYHVLGTDQVGQDVLWRSVKSIRTGLLVGTLTTLVMLPFALLLGVAAGYFRGWVDDVIQYTYTTLSSIPSVLLIAAAILSLHVYITTHEEAFPTVVERADLRLLFLCLILGLTNWTGLCRLLRGETLKLRELDYIQAATALGVRNAQIMARHILPNVMHLVLITVVLDFSLLVLAEAVLSYVGVGVDPSTDSWGNMINSARLEMAREPIVWWSLTSAFAFMFGLVLAANLFADAVRDALDPRLRK
ncbi:MAG: ABC transporter permease [Gammaproteobacteria bacterium]|jgi:peptide/nickel transport system permease protein|nr:ABC transporter permease [Gammaproteobacteria bacterium]